jgi:Chaperone of endosialidase
MQRISTPTRFVDKFGPGKDGFTDGNPATGLSTTQLEAIWFDSEQEEIANAIELSGIALNPADHTQLWQAIRQQVFIVGDTRYVLKTGDVMSGTLEAPYLRAFGGGPEITVGASNDYRYTFFRDPATGTGYISGVNGPGTFFSYFAFVPGSSDVIAIGNFNVQGDINAANVYAVANVAGAHVHSENDINATGTFTGAWASIANDITAGARVNANAGVYPFFSTFPDFQLGAQASGTNATAVNFSGYVPNNFALEFNKDNSIWYFYGPGQVALVQIDSGGSGIFAGNLSSQGPVVNCGGAVSCHRAVAGPWDGPSDARIKQNIEPYEVGLPAILRLQPKIFSFVPETGLDPNRRHVSIIAQDIHPIMPETVTVTPVGPGQQMHMGQLEIADLMSFNPGPITYALVNAVKELAARLDALDGGPATPLPA